MQGHKGSPSALIYSDGASSGNPGPAGIGALVIMDGQHYPIAEPIGSTTNNVAEYTAFIRGMEVALALGARRIEALMDSELLARQLMGRYKVKNEGLKPLFEQARKLMSACESISVRHIPREQNTEADRLSKLGVKGQRIAPAIPQAPSEAPKPSSQGKLF